ncbi:MAG: phosphohistidine phosphatase [Chloroflexota bacterium]|jgi:phosphohistidine phosphatase|nr:phosphohistidine phosphatase [Chloroflexota bacterium]
MTELSFLRHAHAGDPESWDGPDETRPLSEKGEKQADRLGRFLAGVGFTPDAIITSPKIRAARTAEIVSTHLGVPYSVDTRLAGALDLDDLERLLREAADPGRPVIVGHDPDFSELVARLVGANRLPLPKGTFARVDVDRPLVPGAGTLRWFVPPDLLKPAH